MAGIEENPSAFEKLIGYALYNGQVIDRLWSECSAFVAELNGQTDEVKLNILFWLAERWREKISSTASLPELARRYSKAPPLGSLRRAPEEFESLSDDEQGLLIYVVQESLLSQLVS